MQLNEDRHIVMKSNRFRINFQSAIFKINQYLYRIWNFIRDCNLYSLFFNIVVFFNIIGNAIRGTAQGLSNLLGKLKNIDDMVIQRFFFQLVLISSMITLSSCPTWQTISFIPPPNEYDCVYVWTTLGKSACDRLTEDVDFGKKSSWRICKQAKSITFFCQKVAEEYELFSYYILMEMSDISFETWPHV